MADRPILYPASIPQETDTMRAAKYAVEGLGWLAQSVLGNTTTVEGMTVGPNSPAGLSVVVQPGAIYSPLALDATAYSTVGSDSHVIMQQGLLRDAVALTLTPPGTAGQSRVYIIQAICQPQDADPGVLPYYNVADPDTALSGPGNSGTPQNTRRAVVAVVNLKAGAAASTGSEIAPTPDAGFVELARVSLPNGATTITSGSIVANAALRRKMAALPDMVGRLLAVRRFSTPGTSTYTPTAGTNWIRVRLVGGGGGGGGSQNTGAGQVSAGAGGAAAPPAEKDIASGFSGTTMTVGSGGPGGGAGLAGSAGTTTSFGAFLSSPAGAGGSVGVARTPDGLFYGGAAGPASVGGDMPSRGGDGGSAQYTSPAAGGLGGTNSYGAGGPAALGAATGNAAVSPGTGGGGGVQSTPSSPGAGGGVGANGLIEIEEYA